MSTTAIPPCSPAIDPADPAAHDARPASKPGLETEAERDAAARIVGRDETNAPKLTPEQAKTLLLDAARAFDPLRVVREHPFVTVGAAAGAGAVMGSSGAGMFALTGLIRSLTKVIVPFAGIVGQVAAAHIGAKTGADQAAENANAPADSTTI